MNIRIPEKNKKPGVCYAVTDDGLELPVIDVTHPAFACEPTQSEIERLTRDYLRYAERRQKMPSFVMKLFLWYYRRKSLLVRNYKNSGTSFVTGMTIYFFKLGPDNLGAGYAGKIDRNFASALPCVSLRLRLQDMANLLADSLAPMLTTNADKPLHLLNIGGGPTTDSLNTLILLRKRHPQLLADRQIIIHCLDMDREGPHFAERSLESLKASEGPLNGLDIRFELREFNWSKCQELIPILAQIPTGAVMAGSSEGGIFDYCSDEEILSILELLRQRTADDFVMVGTITRDDAILSGGMNTGHLTFKPRNLAAFAALVARSGWKVSKAIARPFSQDMLLVKTR